MNALISETIVNWFRKAGISVENQYAAIAEEDDPFKDLRDKIDALRTVQPDLIPEDINAASLVDVDAEVSAVQPPPTDAEILADFLKTDNISDDELCNDGMPWGKRALTCTGASLWLQLMVQSNCFKLEHNIDNHFSRQGERANNSQRLL